MNGLNLSPIFGAGFLFIEGLYRMDKNKKLVIFQVSKELDKKVNEAVEQGFYSTRANFVRTAIIEKLQQMNLLGVKNGK